ncbi:MAG: hypothetical protein E7532_06425 [Ruminococcaceae bacterium]|nr:hypothetical protein [Oscillospiraceae bacterium]
MYKLLNNNREPFLPPFPQTIQYSDKSDALVYRMNGRDIPPIAGLDDRLNSVILKACAFKSEDRYHSAAQLKAELQNILDTINAMGENLTSAEVLEDKTDKTVSVIDLKRLETSVKEDVTEDNEAETVEAESTKEVDAVSAKEPSVYIEQEEDKEDTVSIFGKAPIPSQRPAEISEQKAAEKKSKDIAEKTPETAKEETKEKKKPKWWIFLIAGLGAAVVAAIIIVLAVSFTSNNSEIIDTEDSNNIGSENNIIYENNNDYVPNDNVEDFTAIMEEEFDTQEYFEEPTTIYEYSEYTESEELPQEEVNYFTEYDLLGDWIEESRDQSYYFYTDGGSLYYSKYYEGNQHHGHAGFDDPLDYVDMYPYFCMYWENGVLNEYDCHTGEWLGTYHKQ